MDSDVNLLLDKSMKLKDIFEEFYDSFKNPRDRKIIEVFKNPNSKEMKEVMGKGDYVRALLIGNDILVWNVFGALHMDIMKQFNLGKDAIPIILYPNADIIDVSDFSKYTNWDHNPNTKSAILNNNWVKSNMSNVQVHYYDEDIEGDWEDLK